MLSLLCSCCGSIPVRSARGISDRAVGILSGGDSAYYLGWKEYARNPYDPVSSPQGCIQLGLAESTLSLDLLQQWMHAHPEAVRIQLDEIAGYPDYSGLPSLKTAFGRFMGEVMRTEQAFDPDKMVFASGATAVIDVLSFCLAEPGDVFLVPAPYYPGFARDCQWRSNVELFPVPCYSSDNFNITAASLASAMKQATKLRKQVRGLIISSPSNPVGNTLQAQTLELILHFINEHSIHLICDEIYAGSTFASPDFISVTKLLEDSSCKDDSLKSRVHLVYGLSKDFGLAGLRIGVLYSWNKQIVSAAARLVRFCSISTHTQVFVEAFLSDEGFVRDYLEENKKRLRKRWGFVVGLLNECGIGMAEGNSGFFCWIDLRKFVKDGDEDVLWKKLVYELGLNLTPGSACCCPEPGWFRLCFASQDEETLAIAVERLKKL